MQFPKTTPKDQYILPFSFPLRKLQMPLILNVTKVLDWP